MSRIGVISILLVVCCSVQGQEGAGPPASLQTLFLTWEDDPTTTMTFLWLAVPEPGPPRIRWADDGTGNAVNWREAVGVRNPFGTSIFDVCRVSLRSLEPDTSYRFEVPGSGRVLRFRTAPEEAQASYTFVSGGDAGPWATTSRVCRLAARHDPLFAVLGGDLAYANGQLPQRWIGFLARWHEGMVTPEGRAIPMLVSIGNHEVNKTILPRSRASAPFFYSLFNLYRERSHARLDIGESARFLFLDTGHTTPISQQTSWLESQLAASSKFPHLFAVYHVPAYPSYRDYEAPPSDEVRDEWVPVFERYGVDVAFEHHDHTYKRTKLIRGGAVAADGVLYFGDGAWGVYERIADPVEDHWYLAATRSTNHFIVTHIDGGDRRHSIYDETGELFDCYPQPPVLLEIVTQPKIELGVPVYDRAAPLRLDVLAKMPEVSGNSVRELQGEILVETEVAARRRVASFTAGENSVSLMNLPEGRNRLSMRGTMELSDGTTREFAWMDKLSFRMLSYDPRPAIVVKDPKPGLRHRVYKNSFSSLDFSGLDPVAEGISPIVGLEPASRFFERFGIVFDGFLRVEEPSVYRFISYSDDASRIFIGEELVVDNDGRHTGRERAGVIALDRGLHPLRIEYFQYTHDHVLDVRVSSAKHEPKPLAPATLFHSSR